jgi:long-chain fatty acid transport protein
LPTLAIVDHVAAEEKCRRHGSTIGAGDGGKKAMAVRLAGIALRAVSALGLVVVATAAANAGGFAVREQSAYGQGTSYAGIAAGGSLSSMFWNPATMTQFAGKWSEFDLAIVMPHTSQSYSSSGLAAPPLGLIFPAYTQGVDNSSNSAVVSSSYSSWQIAPQLWLGMSINTPFGLSVSFPQAWAGSLYGQNSNVESFNAAPAIAYKFNDMISIAAGVQVQYMRVGYDALANPLPVTTASIGGSGFGYGFTVGATITPTPTTTIGIGYRSGINQKIDATLTSSTPGSTPGSVSTTIDLPDMVTVGLRQRIGERFTLLGGFEWTNWSRIGTSDVLQPNGALATISGTPVQLAFQYSDGYLYSLGGEYKLDPAVTLRAGIAYEKSPITDDVRTPRLPDDDRMWYSVGLSYKMPHFDGLVFDLAYSFVDVKSTPLSLGPGTNNPSSNLTPAGTYVGSASSYINIITLGLHYHWDAMPVPPPAKH